MCSARLSRIRCGDSVQGQEHPARKAGMTQLTYLEAAVVGLIQGVTELFPISSLGHNVLLPALVGGSWAADLNVARSESPYLAFVVGLHVATAIALLIYFWRDWVRIVRGFFSSIGHVIRPEAGTSRWHLQSADERLAWLIIVATIPVGLVGLVFEHEFRVLFGKPIRAAIFLIVNGLILLAGERFRRKASVQADREIAQERELVAVGAARRPGAGRHAAGHHTEREAEYEEGVAMVAGMFRGLSREDAARFAFLLATPVILAAGVLKVPDLMGPLGSGIQGQILVGSVLSGVGAYLSVRFLVRYFRTRTLTPFAIYCIVAGLASIVYLSVVQ